MRPALISVGLAAMDRIVEVERMPARGSKGRATGYHEAIGGDAAIAAIVAARLGAEVRLLSLVGDDGAGREIVRGLTAEGVDAGGVAVVSGASSIAEAVLVDRAGQRAAAVYLDKALLARAPLPALERLDGAEVVLAYSSWTAGAGRVLATARMAGLATVAVIDAALASDVDAMGRSADHVVFGDCSGAGALDGSLHQARERLPGQVLVALGAADVAILAEGRVVRLAVPELASLGTQGLSSAFHGAYAVALAEGRPPVAAANFAGAVAALTAQRSRNEPHYPGRADVEALLDASR